MRMKTLKDLLFNQTIEVDADERRLCLKCARAAMRYLRRNRKHDEIFSTLRYNDLMWCLSSYALFLREVAAGRTIRYRKLVEIGVAGASVMGDGRILEILERNGVDVPSARWTWRGLTPFTLAAVSGRDVLAEKLLAMYPALPKGKELEENVKECAGYASPAIVEELLTRIKTKYTANGKRWKDLLGMALFSAVASDRRETITLLLRLGAVGVRAKTDGRYPAHCGSSLFSCAVDNGNFEFADVCLARGWLPKEEDIWDLPNSADALEDLDKFTYLCRAFPKENFRKSVLENWVQDYQVSPEVYAYCGGVDSPNSEEATEDVEALSDEEVLADVKRLGRAISKNPDRVFDLADMDLSRVRELFSTPEVYSLSFFHPYMFRKARSLGIDLFGSKTAERRFVESIPKGWTDCFRAHQKELGWSDYHLQEEIATDTFSKTEEELRYDRAAGATGAELAKILDDPAFDPNAAPYPNWSFAQEVQCLGTPHTFKQWALRGMDTYGQNCEGNYAIDLAEMPRWRMLVTVFGMNPLHIAYDGSSALKNAICGHDNETAKWLWRHGDPSEWWLDSPLRTAILHWNDELARWFMEQGVRNVDRHGHEYPIPPWL